MIPDIEIDEAVRGAQDERELEQSLDPGIAEVVMVLRKHEVETFESCQGGPGHSFPTPAVRFHGDYSEGFRAFSVAIMLELNVRELRRVYGFHTGEIVGPYWELTFSPKYKKSGAGDCSSQCCSLPLIGAWRSR